MFVNLTEPELVEMISMEKYHAFARQTFDLIRETKEFKNQDPVCIHLQIIQLNNQNWLYAESTLKKYGNRLDFGFVKLILSDNEQVLTDYTLDRMNELRRALRK
jgi:ribosome-associated toxin RatA of RatAB toxin-antitoxin module